MNQEIIIKKTLEILVGNIKSVEDLNFVNWAITDYEIEFHIDLKDYRKRLIELRRGYWK